jgi:hypothetical protein
MKALYKILYSSLGLSVPLRFSVGHRVPRRNREPQRRFSLHIRVIIVTAAICMFSCKEKTEAVNPGDYTCKALPSFVRDLGFNAKQSAFSTREKQMMGLVLIEYRDTGNKVYQHPSWREAGWLSVLQIDRHGNIFVAPAPFISVLDNPVSKQNILYKVDARNQQMLPFIELPLKDSSGNARNPFGITGIAYNCRNNLLYVSSISGSDITTERGCLYVIDASSKEIVDRYEGKDFFGLEAGVVNQQVKLLAGSTRTSEVYSFNLTSKGKLSGSPEKIIDLADLGPRGDDKVRKIVFQPDGTLVISGLQFTYNLIASTERPETNYFFRYNDQSGKWMLLQ